MSDNISIVKGRASFMSVKEIAWHGLGQILENRATAEEAIEAAGLGYEVELSPMYADILQTGNKEGLDPEELNVAMNRTALQLVPNKFATHRTDTGDVFGVVGSKYTVVQNREAFSFFDAIVGEGEAIYETAGSLGKGETIFITAKLPGYIRVGNGDDVIEKYLLLTSTHDGSGSIKATFTPIRVVCNNTLQAALGGSTHKVNIRHTASVHDNLALAHKALGIVNVLSNELGECFSAMARKRLEDKETLDFIDNVFLNKAELRELALGAHRNEVLSSRKSNIIQDVRAYTFSHTGGQYESRGTLWGAYNGITGYYNNVKEYSDKSNRMKNLTSGTAYMTGQDAFVLANKML